MCKLLDTFFSLKTYFNFEEGRQRRISSFAPEFCPKIVLLVLLRDSYSSCLLFRSILYQLSLRLGPWKRVEQRNLGIFFDHTLLSRNPTALNPPPSAIWLLAQNASRCIYGLQRLPCL